jgi:hypothetical protein
MAADAASGTGPAPGQRVPWPAPANRAELLTGGKCIFILVQERIS